jgi:hypothetical protein
MALAVQYFFPSSYVDKNLGATTLKKDGETDPRELMELHY